MYDITHNPQRKAPDGGNYNDFPTGWRKITRKVFVQGMFFRYVPAYIETRQMYAKDAEGRKSFNQPYVGATLYWYHDGTGVAMVDNYWKGTIGYFAFGCTHAYKELTQEECRERKIYHAGRCYHVSECSKCHHINAYDSSD